MQPCANGSGALDGGYERKENFKKALGILLEPDGTPRVYRSPEPTKYPTSISPISTPTPIMSSDFENNEAWVNDAWISDDEWPSNGDEGGDLEEGWSETTISVENEEEDWSETSPSSSSLNLWCGDSLDNAIENCGRNGYDCPDGVCISDLKCFTVGDSCANSEVTDLPLLQGSTSPSLRPGVLTLVPTPTTNDDTSQSPASAAKTDILVNNSGLIGQYCASTLAALETECITATTCEKSDDCPEGTYCWGERVCGSPNTTNTPTMSSASLLTPSPSSGGLQSYSPSLKGNELTSEQQPQPIGIFVCGTDFASTNCLKPCPSGSHEECDDGEACFENFTCESDSSHSTLPPQLDTSPQPTQEGTSTQPPSTLLSVLSSEQFLCASKIEDLESSCSTAQSCTNGPCPTGVFCFPYICPSVNGENPATSDFAKSQVPTSIEPSAAPVQVRGLCPPSPFVGWHTSADCKGMINFSLRQRSVLLFLISLFAITSQNIFSVPTEKWALYMSVQPR